MKISVRSIPPKFNRAGEKFTQTPRVLDVDNKKYAILKAEPMLIVETVADEGKGYEDMTKAELTALLEAKGVEVPANATKAVLLELLAKAEEK